MTGVLANDEDLAVAPNDFALIAHLLDEDVPSSFFLSVALKLLPYYLLAQPQAFKTMAGLHTQTDRRLS